MLAVREGDKFNLYQLATGKFRLPGKNWLEFLGKRVAVTGAVQSKKETRIIKVDTLLVLAQSPAERVAENVVGREIDLKLKDLSGIEQSLSLLKGRIVILNFWATYCIPCKAEMPDLAAIQNEYAALGVQVIGASADEAEDRATVLQFIKKTKINFPVWMGATAADMMRFGLGSALPGTVVLGKDGRVAKVISDFLSQFLADLSLPCFDGLRSRRTVADCVIVFYAFDLLHLDGRDLTQTSLISRKAALKKILPKWETGRVRYTDYVVGEGERLFAELERRQLEGMVAKRADSLYVGGRTGAWLKIKTSAGREEMQRRSEA